MVDKKTLDKIFIWRSSEPLGRQVEMDG